MGWGDGTNLNDGIYLWRRLGVSLFSTLGGFVSFLHSIDDPSVTSCLATYIQQLCGYGLASWAISSHGTGLNMNQGVIRNVLVIESFAAKFPEIYMNVTLKVRVISQYISALLEQDYF